MSEQAKLLAAMREARNAMGEVAKSGRNDFDRYDYSTLRDYINGCEVGLAKHGLLLVVHGQEPTWFETGSEKMKQGVRVKIEGHLYHTSGESMPCSAWGEAWDKGDKSLYKAVTGARKYLIASLFNIYTGDDPEIDSPDASDGKPASKPAQRQTPPAPSTNGKKPTPPPPAKTPEAKPAEKAAPKRSDAEACVTPEELNALLKRWEGEWPFAGNEKMWGGIYTNCMKLIKERTGDGSWDSEAAAEALSEGALNNIKTRLDLYKQSKELISG
jgi:hypothetical protein